MNLTQHLKTRIGKAVGISAAGVAGIAASVLAVALTVVPIASAHSISDLSNAGASVQETTLVGGCHDYKVSLNGQSTDLGSDCNTTQFQANIDAFWNSVFPPTTATTTTATPATTTTATTTTTTPATTTTTAAPTTTTTSGQGVTAPATTTTASTTPATTTTTPATTTVVTTIASTPSTPPIASFTTAPTGLVVDFTDASTATAPATIQTVTFLFGDGANATTTPGGTVSHTYTTAGTFTVVEFVTDSEGLTDRKSTDIPVSPFGGVAAFQETLIKGLSAKESRVYGFQVAVYCVASWGGVKAEHGLGLSIVGSRQANIAASICQAIRKGKATGLQLLVANHEVGHALGITAERSADCYGYRQLTKLERQLHIRDNGRRKQAWAYIVKRYGGCRG